MAHPKRDARQTQTRKALGTKTAHKRHTPTSHATRTHPTHDVLSIRAPSSSRNRHTHTPPLPKPWQRARTFRFECGRRHVLQQEVRFTGDGMVEARAWADGRLVFEARRVPLGFGKKGGGGGSGAGSEAGAVAAADAAAAACGQADAVAAACGQADVAAAAETEKLLPSHSHSLAPSWTALEAVEGALLSVFHGGSTREWAPSQDQALELGDLELWGAVTK